jgi:DNA-binding transcriptional regulator YdaS (Cro superfamily)
MIVSLALCALGTFACARKQETSLQDSRLGPNSFARVGAQQLDVALLADPQRPARELSQAVISDALLSLHAEKTLPQHRPAVERAVLGRVMVEELRRQATGGLAPSQATLEAQREANWMLFDRPRAVRVGEIFVPVPELAPEAKYKALAEELHSAAASAHHLEDVLEAIDSVKTDIEIVRRRVPPVAADGRVVRMLPQDEQWDRVERRFAETVTQLQAPGDVGQVFATEGGFSFAYVIEVIPALRPTDEEVRDQLIKHEAAPTVKREMRRIIDQGQANVKRSTGDISPYLELVWRRQ